MRSKRKSRTVVFWVVTVLCLLVGAMQISAVSNRVTPSDLIINEFVAANGTGLTDEDGDYSDWIEIYNRSSQPVNLAGWSLTNVPSQPTKWPFPDITVGAQEYLVIFASGKNRPGLEPGTALHTNFRLNKDGDYLGLHSVLENRFMDEISPQYPKQLRDVSYGRYGEESAFGYMGIPSPGGPNDETLVWAGQVSPVAFSVERGFYEAPFTVELATETEEATIRYTTDGTEPTETNGQPYTEPISINSTTLLRATAFKPTYLAAPVTTHSYIFWDDVLNQPAAPTGFPESWDAQLTTDQSQIKVHPVTADYEMDPQIDSDPRYKDTLKQSLTSLPSLSLAMDSQSFTSLYTNPTERGRSSEQPTSIELIYPDDKSENLQTNAGLGLYGEISEISPKRSFQLFFRSDYGPTKLEFPLYPDSPVVTFDTLLLKAGIDGSLANPTASNDLTAYARNQWLRDSQIAVSGLGAHGTYVHLYINGLYWGVYNLAEKPNDSFMESYVGGDESDWFLANHTGPLDEAADRFSELNYLFTTLSAAPQLSDNQEPPDYLSDIFAEAAARIDPAQFSDYLILYWYAVNQDWPASNWTAAIHRQDPPGQGRFIIGDESTTRINDSPKTGANVANIEVPQLGVVKILFNTLMQEPDFRVLFADRVYKQLLNDGELSDASAQTRWQEISQILEPAIIAESARWGDLNRDSPFTQADWLKAQNSVLEQMQNNADRFIAMAREAGYYPSFDPPRFSQNGGLVEAGFELNMSLTPNAEEGTIYYTINGTDPRLPVTGDIASDATAYTQPVILTENSIVRARVFDGQSWSALNEATFNVVKQDTKLRLTEIMYNPRGGDDYEFIELKNLGNSELSTANMSFVEGIRYTFPPDTPPLKPGEFVVLVRNPEIFAERYPDVIISGAYDGSLSNKGETLTLIDAQSEIVIDVTYNDASGWPISPDGRGDSLVLVTEDGNPSDPKNWRASLNLHGSPGMDE